MEGVQGAQGSLGLLISTSNFNVLFFFLKKKKAFGVDKEWMKTQNDGVQWNVVTLSPAISPRFCNKRNDL